MLNVCRPEVSKTLYGPLASKVLMRTYEQLERVQIIRFIPIRQFVDYERSGELDDECWEDVG